MSSDEVAVGSLVQPKTEMTEDIIREKEGREKGVQNDRTDRTIQVRTASRINPTSMSLVRRPDLAVIPTLFPAPVANLITALATSARVSLRLSTFFIEAMLETSQYSTRLSLGYTRRLLITAISSARRVYLMSHAAREGDFLSLVGLGDDKISPTSTDGFLQVLDKYTNLGIYIIHHTFTLAELFTMSGFYLTANAVQSAHFAAQESVSLFDSLFGSNESSRALSSIITLVRRELVEDDRFKEMEKGKVASLTALTKALTAFACLQNATWKRTAQRLRMKVLYDCTVLKQNDDKFKTGSESNPMGITQSLPFQSNDIPAIAGPGPTTRSSRDHVSRPALDEVNGRLWAHLNRPTDTQQLPSSQSRMSLDEWDLEDLVGESGKAEYDAPQDEATRRRRQVKRIKKDVFEITDEYTESTVVTQTFEQLRAVGGDRSHDLSTHRRLRSAPLPDVTVDVMDDPPTTAKMEDAGSPGKEDDWVEVDQLLDNEGIEIPSVPNGATSMGSTSYRDALEHPNANAERIQLVLRTMTNKLLQRKRTVRRLPEQAEFEDLSVVTPRNLNRGDVRGGPWTRSRAGSPSRSVSTSSTTPTLSSTPATIPTTNAGVMTPKGKRRGGRSPTPTQTPIAVEKRPSSMGRAMSKARTAFKPLTSRSQRTSRAPSPTHIPPIPSTSSIEPIKPTTVKAPPPSALSRSQKRNIEKSVSPPKPPPNTIRYAAHRGGRDHHNSSHMRMSVDETTDTHSSQRTYRAASAQAIPTSGDDIPERLFPHDSLLNNIHRFMRFSSAAYGQNFLRIFGMGNSDYNFPSSGRHHANSWSFAQHTRLPIESLLLSSYTESTPTFGETKAQPLVHYVAVDHTFKAIILTCRGTLGLSDVLIDLTCEYCPVTFEGGDPGGEYYAHSGMYQSAVGLTAPTSTVHQTLISTLEKYPSYGLVVTGHSLGGGVAGLLSILCSIKSETFLKLNTERSIPIDHPPIATPFVTSFMSGLPPGRPVHCYAYGVPAITSIDLANYAKGLITSVVHKTDVVPCLSLGVLRDLKNIALTLYEEGMVAEEIVGRVIGIYQRKFAFQNEGATSTGPGMPGMDGGKNNEDVLADWMMSLIKTMRADMDSEKLYPPGSVYIIEYFDVYVTRDGRGEGIQRGEKMVSQKQAHRVILHKCESVQERFREPLFTKTMLNDHLPTHYERATQLLVDGMTSERG